MTMISAYPQAILATKPSESNRCATNFMTKRRRLSEEHHVSQPTKKSRRLSKSVKFCEQVDIIYHEFDQSDAQNAWYSQSDYKRFKTDCLLTLKSVESVDGDIASLDHSHISVRGLEDQIVRFMYCLTTKKKAQFIQLVLQQQEVSRLLGHADPQRLRSVSETFSQESKDTAIKMGQLDSLFLEKETGWFLCC